MTTAPIQISTHQDAAGASRGDFMAVRVQAELLRLAPPSGVVEVHQPAIAQLMQPQVSVKSVYRALQDLVAAECLQYDRAGNRPNEYILQRDLAQTRIAITQLYRSRRSGMSEDMSDGMSDVSDGESVEVPIVASFSRETPMSDAAGDTQPIRARDTSPSSWSSSGSDTSVMSETTAEDRVLLQDPSHLKVAGLIKAAHIDPTREACEAMALLTTVEQLEALRRALKADEPNPAYLVKCVGTVLRKRGANELPSVLPLLYPDAFAEPTDEPASHFEPSDEVADGEVLADEALVDLLTAALMRPLIGGAR